MTDSERELWLLVLFGIPGGLVAWAGAAWCIFSAWKAYK